VGLTIGINSFRLEVLLNDGGLMSCLQETKIELVSRRLVHSLWGIRHVD
jgi:hypothetical protein